MMNELIVQQEVNRRKPSVSMVHGKTRYSATHTIAGYTLSKNFNPNANLIMQIKQKPDPIQRYKKDGSFVPIVTVRSGSTASHKKPVETEQKSFVFTRLSIILLGGVVVFALIALNWPAVVQAFKISMLPGGSYTLEPGSDREIPYNLASYVGLADTAPITPEDDIPLNLVETFAWESYAVKRGDSISKIAVSHSISMDAIVASNTISNARLLREGEVLRIPNMDGIPYTVKKGDSLSKISNVMGVPLEVILDANDIQSSTLRPDMVLFIPGAKMKTEDLKVVLGELFIYPIRGRLTSPFGWRNDPISGVRRYHGAVDLAASTGTPVKAAMDGRISTVGFNSVYGKYIIITHNDGYQTMYAHLNTTAVTQGAYVSQGSKIGEVGSTGYSTGPHLHFALYKNGRAVNPLDFLKS